MIKILSGHSFQGGSTIAHINLCNLFNKHGIPCKFFGRHNWHLDKCDAALLEDTTTVAPEDIVIAHYLTLVTQRPNVRRLVLSSHETDNFPLRNQNLQAYDVVHFVSESQKQWHGIGHPSVVIPNVVAGVRPRSRPVTARRIAGVIGSIDSHKQPHLSIERAIDAGCQQVWLFGMVNDGWYFRDFVRPLIERFPGRIFLMGHVDDRQRIYEAVDIVYHSSKRETFNFIKAECHVTHTPYDGLSSADTDAEYLDEETILHRWKSLLGTE
jgi:hypothetical protein